MNAATSPWFVYLIACRGGSIYTGISTDVAARYATHVEGKGARYTRMHPPEKLLAVFEFPDRSSALKEEYRIKQMDAPQKHALANQGAALSQTSPVEAVPNSRI